MYVKGIKSAAVAVLMALAALMPFTAVYADDTRAPGWAGYNAENGVGTIGGANGEEVTVSTLDDFLAAVSDNTPRIVTVDGTIDLGAGIMRSIGSYKTIVGIDSNAGFIHGGFQINGTQVILRNLTISNAITPINDYDDAHGKKNTENDNININGGTYVWVDRCTLNDGQYDVRDADINHHDGLLDIKNGADYVTVSNCIIENHNKTSLIGAGESKNAQALDRGKLKVTYINNWFRETSQRNPRVRYGSVHLVNNYYQSIFSYVAGVGTESRIYSENNYFESDVNTAWSDATKTSGYVVYDENGNVVENPDFDTSGCYYDSGSYYASSSSLSRSNAKAIEASEIWNPKTTEGYNYIEPMQTQSVKKYVKLHAGQGNAESILHVDNRTNTFVTQESYKITGFAGMDCKLRVIQNENEVYNGTTAADVDFSIPVTLAVGDNIFSVIAETDDGKKQEYGFTVELKQFEVTFTSGNIAIGTYTGKAVIENNTSEPKDVIFLAAFYDNMGELLRYTPVYGTVEPNNGKLTLTAQITGITSSEVKVIQSDASSIVPRVKLFVWEGTDIKDSNMLVYSKSYTKKRTS